MPIIFLVEQVIFLQGTRGVKATEGFIRSGLSEKQFGRVVQALSSQGRILLVEPNERKYVHEAAVGRVGNFMERVLAAHHRDFPDREGMTRAELGGKLSLIFDDKEVAAVLGRLVKLGRMVQEGQHYLLPGHEKNVSGQDEELLEKCIEAIRAGGVQPPRRGALFDAAS